MGNSTRNLKKKSQKENKRRNYTHTRLSFLLNVLSFPNTLETGVNPASYWLSLAVRSSNKHAYKQIWSRVDCQHSEKRSKTHKRVKNAFNWTKQDKTCKFSRKSSFSSYVQHKNRRRQTQLIQLILFFFFFLCCTQFEKEDFLENWHVCPVSSN